MSYDYLTTETITYDSSGTVLSGFLSRPVTDMRAEKPFLDLSYQVPEFSSERMPAIAVVFEMYGLAEHIKDVAFRLAREGYVSLAPDLFSDDPAWNEMDTWDVERGRAASRSGKPEETEASIAALPVAQQAGARRALPWIQTLGSKNLLPHLTAAVDYLKQRPDVDPQRIGVLGFCMGGGVAARLAVSRDDLAAVAVYYGPMPDPEQVEKLTCPLIGHFGTLDPLADRARPFDEAMQSAGKPGAVHYYEGAPHRFFNDTRPFYQPAPAEKSWERTLEFFAHHLGV